MRLRALLLSSLVALLLVAASPDERYRVIANSSVPVTSLSKSDLSLLFLKKMTTYQKWGNSGKVVPVDLTAESETRIAFTKAVHQKAVTAIKAYWQQQIFSGRGAPPTEVASDAEVIAAVAKSAGAIGYVSAGAALPEGVKVVRVTE